MRESIVKKGVYLDSLRLMSISEQARKIPGVKNSVIALATETNKALVFQLGLGTDEVANARSDDLIIALELEDNAEKEKIIKEVEALLFSSGQQKRKFYSIETAISKFEPNFAVVSLPAEEAIEATEELLKKGVNVQLFSDGISVEEEVRLKKLALEKGLLLLGPESGTSIIDGFGLCFSNAVEKGNVGIVASAGTGLQELVTLLDSCKIGISNAFGVGGSDLTREVNGMMTKRCLEILDKDDETEIVCVISKRPDEVVTRELKDFILEKIRKKVVACFIGNEKRDDKIIIESTVHSCAKRIAKMENVDFHDNNYEEIEKISREIISRLEEGRKYIRGIYSGGSLATETTFILKKIGVNVKTNKELENPMKSIENTILDIGDSFFTKGRAHPMIDPTLRKIRLGEELRDRSVATLIFDLVIGYGVPQDPASHIAEVIRHKDSRIAILSHLVGTKKDKQNYEAQKKKLLESGSTVCFSNTEMAVLSALIASRLDLAGKVKQNWDEFFGS